MIKGTLLTVHLDKIKPNPWNPNKQSEFIFSKERASIKKFGFLDPILVREKGKNFEIVDGEHRFRAGLAEGIEEFPVWNLGQVKDEAAKQLTIIMNETKGEPQRDKLVELLKDLEKSVGVEELLKALPYQESEINDFLKSVKVDWSAVNDLGPVVIGENYNPDSSENPPAPLKKNEIAAPSAIHIEVPANLVSSFNSQIERIQKELSTDTDLMCHIKDAVDLVVKILAKTDLKSFISNGSKKVIRRPAVKQNKLVKK